jgi:hypothetical protein
LFFDTKFSTVERLGNAEIKPFCCFMVAVFALVVVDVDVDVDVDAVAAAVAVAALAVVVLLSPF